MMGKKMFYYFLEPEFYLVEAMTWPPLLMTKYALKDKRAIVQEYQWDGLLEFYITTEIENAGNYKWNRTRDHTMYF
uniref:Uncharacterized protein n=1 Tax=Octopus bimaculoides TaxID=37653 RepID=A0A0L8GVR2_OCTBM